MKKIIMLLLIVSFYASMCFAMGGNPPESEGMAMAKVSNNPHVVLETTKGKILIELFPDKAPEAVKNFLGYAVTGFYDGTIFHRVIPGFMIQGGGMSKGLVDKMTLSPIKNEAGNGLLNKRGTVAMARTNVPDSATAQFFINTVDNDFLDHQNDTPQGYGYCVFGNVVQGMDVVDAISQVRTHTVGYYENVPVEDVEIKSAKKI